MSGCIQAFANFATVLGFPIAILGLVYVGSQFRRSAKIAEGQFLLELAKMFLKHGPVHRKLRPRGDWSDNRSGPSSNEEWADIDSYMGLFEHCEILMRQGSLNPHNFANLYAYRVRNILNHAGIVEKKLKGKERVHWSDFLSLIERLEKMGKVEKNPAATHLLPDEKKGSAAFS